MKTKHPWYWPFHKWSHASSDYIPGQRIYIQHHNCLCGAKQARGCVMQFPFIGALRDGSYERDD